MTADLENIIQVQNNCLFLRKSFTGCENYVGTMIGRHIKNFHNFITGYNVVDHIDCDPLNNCKSNLRITSIKKNNKNRSISTQNTSGYVGVYKTGNTWCAKIKENDIETVHSFNINDYGINLAKELAIMARIILCQNHDNTNGMFGLKPSEIDLRNFKVGATIDMINNEIIKSRKIYEDILDDLLDNFNDIPASFWNQINIHERKDQIAVHHSYLMFKIKLTIDHKNRKNNLTVLKMMNDESENSEIDSNDTLNDINNDESENSEIESNDTLDDIDNDNNNNDTLDDIDNDAPDDNDKETLDDIDDDNNKETLDDIDDDNNDNDIIDDNNDNDIIDDSDDGVELVNDKPKNIDSKKLLNNKKKINKSNNNELSGEQKQDKQNSELDCETMDNFIDAFDKKLNIKSRQDKTRKKISEKMKAFNATEDGKTLKQKSLEKRSKTMNDRKEIIRKNLVSKTCRKCQVNKSLDEYNKKSNAKDGLQPYCKECVNLAKVNYRTNNKKKEYKCDICDAVYMLKDSLTRHKKQKH